LGTGRRLEVHCPFRAGCIVTFGTGDLDHARILADQLTVHEDEHAGFPQGAVSFPEAFDNLARLLAGNELDPPGHD
jgi:hypothetical protein